jgi:hypothetical protein
MAMRREMAPTTKEAALKGGPEVKKPTETEATPTWS